MRTIPLYFAPDTAFPLDTEMTYPRSDTHYVGDAPTLVFNRDNRRLYPIPYGSSTYVSGSTQATVSEQLIQFGRFISSPFSADTSLALWYPPTDYFDIATCSLQSNVNANFEINCINLFVWRPSIGCVVREVMYNTKMVSASPSIPSVIVGSYSVDKVSAPNYTGEYDNPLYPVGPLVGDVLVVEVFARFTQSVAAAYTVGLAYGGPTDIFSAGENTLVPEPASGLKIYATIYPANFSDPLNYIQLPVLGDMRSAYVSPPILLASACTGSGSQIAALSDGAWWQLRLAAHSSCSAALSTRVLLSAAHKVTSAMECALPQVHLLSSAIQASPVQRTISALSYPIPTLHLQYSNFYGAATSLGGPVGGYLQSQQVTVDAAISGISVRFACNFSGTDNALRVSRTEGTISLLQGGRVRTVALPVGDQLTIGSNDLGYLILDIDKALLPVDTGTYPFSFQEPLDTLFTTPLSEVQMYGGVDYRCLYLHNSGREALQNVTLSVSGPTISSVLVGTEFTNSMDNARFNTSAMYSFEARAISSTGLASMISITRQHPNAMHPPQGGTPFLYARKSSMQASNGVDVDIPRSIPTDTDPLGDLSSIPFASSVWWSMIQPESYVTFWVQRTTPPGIVTSALERLRVAITATF